MLLVGLLEAHDDTGRKEGFVRDESTFVLFFGFDCRLLFRFLYFFDEVRLEVGSIFGLIFLFFFFVCFISFGVVGRGNL